MKILIVESDAKLGGVWQAHMVRQGHAADLAQDQHDAACALERDMFDIIILDVVLARGSAFAVADLAVLRNPEVRIIFVTSTSFFSDGSIFALNANACAFVQTDTPPEDLTAMAEHFAGVR